MEIIDKLLSLPPSLAAKVVTSEKSSLWMVPMTAVYFVYVTLGAISPAAHEHVFTGDMDKPYMENMKKGHYAIIPKQTYKVFYFPAYLKYWNTYRIHTVGAGIWLLTAFYNLRNQPQLGRLANGKLGYPRSTLHRASGYVYLIAGFLKAITVPLMAYNSHSLANWIRVPLGTLGIWDTISLGVAAYQIIVKRDIPMHKRWMIRNFSAGAGSIWVRVFGTVWSICDLEFMRVPDQFGQMNGYALLGGFYYGVLYGEWWLAKDPKSRRGIERIMGALCLWIFLMGKRMYRKCKPHENKSKLESMAGGCPALAGA